MLLANVFSQRILFPWVFLAGICVVHVAIVWHLHPTNFFGWTTDDAIYFSSARALADGYGYVLPHLPGTPPATKYPILYPWLLSWVWHFKSEFPANLSLAAVVNQAFGVTYVVMVFLFLRTLHSISDVGALIVTAFCSLHPAAIELSANLIADIPFAAVTLASFVLAERTLRKGGGWRITLCCGVFAGIGVLLKILGIPVAAGLFLALWMQGSWRKSLAFAAGVLPFFVGLMWRSILPAPAKAPAIASACSQSWQSSWMYLTNYQAFWRSSAIDHRMFLYYIKINIISLLYQLAAYFVDLRELHGKALAMFIFVLIGLAVFRGLVRQIQIGGWHPVHFALAVYLAPVLIWNWPSADRFLIPYLALLAAAIWLEASQLMKQMRISLSGSKPWQVWLSGILCATAVGATIYVAGISWRQGIRAVADLSQYRATLLSEKREAYQWLRDNTPPDARVIAYEEATMFLYTGRQGMSPTILSPAGKVDTQLLDSQLSCLLATAGPIGARYWLSSEDDFKLEWEAATLQERSRSRELEKSHQQFFRSSQGRVRIYRLTD